jgi:hypothetical protein
MAGGLWPFSTPLDTRRRTPMMSPGIDFGFAVSGFANSGFVFSDVFVFVFFVLKFGDDNGTSKAAQA